MNDHYHGFGGWYAGLGWDTPNKPWFLGPKPFGGKRSGNTKRETPQLKAKRAQKSKIRRAMCKKARGY